MSDPSYVALINHGMGNLFSVQQACMHLGIPVKLTSNPKEIEKASGVILPGVGAFEDAMNKLKEKDLIIPLKEHILADRPFLGVCLGMQLLMTESQEFGVYRGLDIFQGRAVRFQFDQQELKVPHVGWNTLEPYQVSFSKTSPNMYAEIEFPSYMYFMHSYYVVPEEREYVVTETTYGKTQFCSSLQKGNVFGCQFHPERSGKEGLKIYQNFKKRLNTVYTSNIEGA